MTALRFFVHAHKGGLDRPWIHDRLKKSYWGKWLSSSQIEVAIENSHCFGAYLLPELGSLSAAAGGAKQIGFLRVVSDDATFSSIMDVFVDEPYRKNGVGTKLMRAALERFGHTINVLSTNDASAFYAHLGYKPCRALKRDPDAI